MKGICNITWALALPQKRLPLARSLSTEHRLFCCPGSEHHCCAPCQAPRHAARRRRTSEMRFALRGGRSRAVRAVAHVAVKLYCRGGAICAEEKI